MSIELKHAAQQAVDAFDAFGEDDDFASLFALAQKMRALRTAIQQAEAKTDEPVQADSSGPLRVIASLGAALRRLSFAAQTTGGTDGPDAELQSAIGQAEQALSMGGIGQAMFATTEPVGARDALTHPAPSVPMAKAWAEGYRQGIEDERISEANIGIAGFGAKVNPSRQNPYSDTHPAPGVPEGFALVPLKATPKAAMVLYEGARRCFSPKVAEGLWQDALTAAQAQKDGG